MTPKFICFTGHRDKLAFDKDLIDLARRFPDSVWIHGGAQGFDSQVDKIAEQYGIQRIIVPPAYHKYHNMVEAPLRRNDVMISLCDHVVALYDGRLSGGTFYTINRARKEHKPVKKIPVRSD